MELKAAAHGSLRAYALHSLGLDSPEKGSALGTSWSGEATSPRGKSDLGRTNAEIRKSLTFIRLFE